LVTGGHLLFISIYKTRKPSILGLGAFYITEVLK